MRKSLLSLAAAAALFSSSCVMTNSPFHGTIYTDMKTPVFANEKGPGPKTGMSKSTGILGFVSGDSSVDAAAKDGGIKKIWTVDQHTKVVLGVWGEYTCIVTGE